MYTIGQFSKIGRVSPKTLRYYDEIGLLKPKFIDQANQYRYYSEEQVLEVLFINELKGYGLKLEHIKMIVDKRDPEVFQELLENRLKEIEGEVQKIVNMKQSIKIRLENMNSGGSLMEPNKELKVELKERETLVVVSKRQTISMEDVGSLIGKVFEEIYRMNLQPSGPVMTLYYDMDFDPENTDVEVCIPVNKKINTEKKENVRELEGGIHACTTFVGPYSKIGKAYATLMKWMEENGYECSGCPFDVYLTDPQTTKSPDEYVTEVCFPVRKK